MSDALTLLIVRSTFGLLVMASALTWALVVVKAFQKWKVGRQDRGVTRALEGLRRLPTVGDLAQLEGPAARVALAGARAWSESRETSDGGAPDLDIRRDLLERSLQRQVQRERRGIEAGLPVLASVGATAPFVGLFGTVLGIVHALQRIGGSGSASLDVVAGPIGEALVATAIGIAVAVPAVLSYNYFLRQSKTFAAELGELANDFVGSAVKSFARIERTPASERDARVLVGEKAAA